MKICIKTLLLVLVVTAPAFAVFTDKVPITYVTKAEFDAAISNMVDTVVTGAISQILTTNLGYASKAGWAYQANHATNADIAGYAVSSSYSAISGVASNSGTSGYSTYAGQAGTAVFANVAQTVLDNSWAINLSNMVNGLTNQYVGQSNDVLKSRLYVNYEDCIYISYSSNAVEAPGYFNGAYWKTVGSYPTYTNDITGCFIRKIDYWELWSPSDLKFTNSFSATGVYYSIVDDSPEHIAVAGLVSNSQVASIYDLEAAIQDVFDAAVTGTVAYALSSDYARVAGTASRATNANWSYQSYHSTNSDYASYASTAGTSANGANYLYKWSPSVYAGSLYAKDITNAAVKDAVAWDLYAMANYKIGHSWTSDYSIMSFLSLSADHAVNADYASIASIADYAGHLNGWDGSGGSLTARQITNAAILGAADYMASTVIGSEGVRRVGAIGGYTLEEFLNDTGVKGPTLDKPTFIYSLTNVAPNLVVAWTSGDVYVPAHGYYHINAGSNTIQDFAVNYAYWNVSSPNMVSWTTGNRPAPNDDNVYLATFYSGFGLLTSASIAPPMGNMPSMMYNANAVVYPSLVARGVLYLASDTNLNSVVMTPGIEYQDMVTRVDHPARDLSNPYTTPALMCLYRTNEASWSYVLTNRFIVVCNNGTNIVACDPDKWYRGMFSSIAVSPYIIYTVPVESYTNYALALIGVDPQQPSGFDPYVVQSTAYIFKGDDTSLRTDPIYWADRRFMIRRGTAGSGGGSSGGGGGTPSLYQVLLSGDNTGGILPSGMGNPSSDDQAACKGYVDSTVGESLLSNAYLYVSNNAQQVQIDESLLSNAYLYVSNNAQQVQIAQILYNTNIWYVQNALTANLAGVSSDFIGWTGSFHDIVAGEGAASYGTGVAIGPYTYTYNGGVAIGYASDGSNGTAVGYASKGYDYGTALGFGALGWNYGVSLGYYSVATNHSVAVGYSAVADEYGIAIGQQSFARTSGVAVGASSIGDINGVAVGYASDGRNGTAIGYASRGYDYGTSLGFGALGWNYGVSLGYSSIATNHSVAVGYSAVADEYGAAVGQFSLASKYGSALGSRAVGDTYGVAVGEHADGTNYGVAVGGEANACNNGVAVGYLATATNSASAIGKNSYNFTPNTLAIQTGTPVSNYHAIALGYLNGNFMKSSSVSGIFITGAAASNSFALAGGLDTTYLRRDGNFGMAGTLDMAGNFITNVPWPTATNHVATKGYVDSVTSAFATVSYCNIWFTNVLWPAWSGVTTFTNVERFVFSAGSNRFSSTTNSITCHVAGTMYVQGSISYHNDNDADSIYLGISTNGVVLGQTIVKQNMSGNSGSSINSQGIVPGCPSGTVFNLKYNTTDLNGTDPITEGTFIINKL